MHSVHSKGFHDILLLLRSCLLELKHQYTSVHVRSYKLSYGILHFEMLQVKVGPFAEHSNQLWNVSGVASWSKINSGLVKMYKVEVSIQIVIFNRICFNLC